MCSLRQQGERRPLTAGPLVALLLAGTPSQLLEPSRGLVNAFALPGMRDRFSKEHDESRRFGRYLCDEVRRQFRCAGFFTTDELPRYGLTAQDRDRLFALYREADPHTDVLVVAAYPRVLASKIRSFVLSAVAASTEVR